MNLIDRTIALLAPRAALRRAQARHAMRYLEGSTSTGPDWYRNTGRVSDVLPMRAVNRDRIRTLVATNPYARKALNALKNNLIGYGITGTPKTSAPKRVAREWAAWMRRADWLGALDFHGLQDLAIGAMLADGESFVVRRTEGNGSTVPLRIEVLDAAMLAEWQGRGGIEYDDRGRPLKYHFRKLRKGSAVMFSGEVVSFDAKDVIHLFARDYPGQSRGRSLFEPVVKRYEDMEAYAEAEIVRKQIEACFAAFIQPSIDGADADLGKRDGSTSDSTGIQTESLEPGMMLRLNPGETVTFGEPKSQAGMAEFARVTLLGATAGVGVPYEHGTGDLSNVNYSSYRAGSLEFQRFCGRLQWLLIVPVMLDRVWEWFCEAGFEIGVFSARAYEIEWTPAAFESVDPLKEAKGRVAEMEAGLTTRRRLLGERGYNFDDTMAEIAADRDAQAALGLSFTGDPKAIEGASSLTAVIDPALAGD